MDIENTGYIPQVDSSDGELSSSTEAAQRKRRRRTAEPPQDLPLKRRKGTLHAKYINLLNDEIADASRGIIKDPEDPFLGHTQVGAVVWTAAEKRAYFSALERLGRDDTAGIAARIGSKSVLEVNQYTVLLADADCARRSDADRVQRVPRAVDIPAAAELGTELCAALEAAADDVSLRQEAREARLEQVRWGGSRWLVTPSLIPALDHQLREAGGEVRQELLTQMPFAELFRLGTWLKLSERVFMNSAVVPDGNWHCASEDPPAIRATALADFHALAVSVTRRLVSAALFVAQSRIRARHQAGSDRRHRVAAVVKAKDVQAAIASVGMKDGNNSRREFWARAARRLRLDIYDDYDSQSEASIGSDEEEGGGEEEDGGDNDDDGASETRDQDDENNDIDDINDPDFVNNDSSEEDNILDQDQEIDTTYEPDIMSYDDVEAALGFPNLHPERPSKPSWDVLPDVSSTSGSDTDSDQDHPSQEEAENAGSSSDISIKEDNDATIDPDLVAQDIAEATMHYSSTYTMSTARARQAVARTIRAELQREAEADRFDSQTGVREEARLWGMLKRGEDYDGEDGDKDRKPWAGGDQAEADVDGGNNWRDYTEYYGEWEFEVTR